MKSHQVLLTVLAVFLLAAVAPAQQRSTSPQSQQNAQQDTERLQELVLAARRLGAQEPQQRGGGGRGVPAPGLEVPANYRATVNRYFAQVGGAWWTNPAMITRLGITDDQKTKLDRAFENHRQKLESSKALLEKEESQLARLLESEPIDRNAVLSQIDRVVQARGEMERANSAMTLEMRESLTRAQWMQVQQQPIWNVVPLLPGTRGGAGGRGARRGGPGQQ